LFGGGGAACTDYVAPSAPTLERIDEKAQQLAQLATERIVTLDDELEGLVARIPGFAGFFFDETGAINVYLKDSRQTELARTELLGFLQQRSPGADATRWSEPLSRMRVHAASLDFAELRATYRAIIKVLPSRGITRSDIDETTNRIRIGVLDVPTKLEVERRTSTLELPSGAVTVEIIAPRVVQTTLQQYSRPLLAGFQITVYPGAICTLGHSMKKYVLGVNDGNRYYVTNSHCTSVFGSVSSDAVGQPTLANGFAIEVLDPPLFSNAENYNCPVGRSCRYSDAALVQVNVPDSWTPGHVARTNLGSITISGAPRLMQGQGYLGWVGLAAWKVGRTTGTTSGQITSQCVDEAQYVFAGGNFIDTGRTMLCQVEAAYQSQGGDSGSPVYNEPFGTRYGIGIHWGSDATTAVFSNINYIENEFAMQNGQITYSVLP
jgi:hypothetical protein